MLMLARLTALLTALLAAGAALAQTAYTNFETVPVRPLALSPDGSRLFAVNPPDGRLEIFDVDRRGLRHRHSVAVGLEPVAVAARTRSEVWVVNHLSDSVSVVDVGADPPRVVRTLLVGDEPWDVVFAGPREGDRGAFTRAFVTATRRGQNHPENPNAEQKTLGIGRADVWVFDADDLGAPLGGTPETIVQLFGDKPRGLAASPDGSVVYAAVFHSGNRTTSVNSGAVCDGGADRGPCRLGLARADDPPVEGEPGTGSPPVLPGGLPAPNQNAAGDPAPEEGLVVRYNELAQQWQDELGRNWNGAVPFSLPDLDVFALDALAQVPQQIGAWPSVGTVLFQLAVHRSGRVYVANSEARNEVRFEGPGTDSTTVRGHLHEARISVLAADGSVRARHLNKHIDYGLVPVPEGVRERSLSTPTGLAFSAGGSFVYVAALGSDAVGVFRVSDLDRDQFVPDASRQIPVPGGPVGLVMDRLRSRLYVYTRFDNAVVSVDPQKRRELSRVALPDLEPEVVTAGRRFLYDARLTSSNGEASCGVCHVFGDKDDLAWDLGNPDGVTVPNPNPFVFGGPPRELFHPMKGPMTTQTLRGMDHHGPMHWRGDRTGADDPASGDAFDEVAGFRAFNGAFDGLLGRDEGPLPAEDMQAFADFALTIFPPPNPIRPLDNRNTGTLAEGARTYTNVRVNILGTCDTCHRLSPLQGFFGTQGLTVFDPGEIKIPHLRNVYDKVGAFGLVAFNPPGNSGTLIGDQIRGFGLHHSGSIGGVSAFLTFGGFVFPDGPAQKSAVEDFVIAFPSNLAPIVGQQVTRGADAGTSVDARIDLLVAQAGTPWVVLDNPGPMSCDLVVKGVVGGEARGWLYDPASAQFHSDRADEPGISDAGLRALAAEPGQALTFTCATPGSGLRVGVDRDADGSRDRDELDLGTDPDAAGSVTGACDDGRDNDGDGAVDWPADADCADADADSELGGPPVRIDVEPGSRGNVVRLHEKVSVAVLGSDEVDVRDLDLSSLAFGPDGALPYGRGRRLGWLSRRDVNRDGHPDQVVLFDAGDTGLAPGDEEACLTGELAGAGFRACDEVEVRSGHACRGWNCR